MQRRCILVNCEKVEKKNINLIDLKLCNFDWSEHILKFWGNYERARPFTMLGLEYPRNDFQGETARINYYQDIYSLFRMFGISDPMDRINAFENREFNLAKDSSLDQMLKLFIEGLDNRNSIKNSTLSRFITSRVAQDEIERPSAKEIRDAMYRLGYVEKWSDTDLRWIK